MLEHSSFAQADPLRGRLLLAFRRRVDAVGHLPHIGREVRVPAQGDSGESSYLTEWLADIGQQVTAGQPLFALDETAERAGLDQARAALVLSEAEFARQEKLLRMGPAAQQDYDRARSTRDQDRQRLAQAEWNFNQKKQSAPQSGLVYDTLFRQGEWVPAGKPVVVLLPPQNIKVRAFVPETRVGSIHYDDPIQVTVDGVQNPFIGKVSYISPRAEYTPPVIYSRESRAKLVFMIESVFEPQVAANLHPGQPVDVEFKSK